MKQRVKAAACLLLCVGLLSCQTMTDATIQSNVVGASVYIDEVFKGETAAESDGRTGTLKVRLANKGSTIIKLTKEGYETVRQSAETDVKVINIIGGLFLLVPFIWVVGPAPLQIITMQALR